MMAKLIDLKIHKSETILRNNHEIFSDIADRRATVMGDLQETFTNFLNRPENFSADQLFPDKKPGSSSIATGSGLAVVGIILAAVTKLAVFDITGGVLTAVGVLFAGFTSAAKKRKIMEGYQQEIVKGRVQLQEDLSTKLRTYVTSIKQKIDANFEGFDAMLEREAGQVAKLEERQGGIEGRLERVEMDLN